MDSPLSAADRYRLIAGSTFELTLTAGNQVRIETDGIGLPAPDDAAVPTMQTLTADADGELSIELSAAGQYWLAWRESATAARWCPVGVIDVLPIRDTREVQLRADITDLDERIRSAAAINHQVSGPDGSSVQRAGLATLRRQRALAETRLADYLRRRRRLPAAMPRG